MYGWVKTLAVAFFRYPIPVSVVALSPRSAGVRPAALRMPKLGLP